MAVVVQARSRYEPEPTKGSRFIATVVPIETSAHAKDAIAQIRAEMPDATHHCWAWRLEDRSQSSDDGEPGGSAGRPILAQLAGHDVVGALVVVTRYFGGTKLGVGGLVRAYGAAAGQALDRAETVPFVSRVAIAITCAYDDDARVDAVLRRHDVRVADTDYGAAVTRTLLVPRAAQAVVEDDLRDATAGRVEITAPAPEGGSDGG